MGPFAREEGLLECLEVCVGRRLNIPVVIPERRDPKMSLDPCVQCRASVGGSARLFGNRAPQLQGESVLIALQ